MSKKTEKEDEYFPHFSLIYQNYRVISLSINILNCWQIKKEIFRIERNFLYVAKVSIEVLLMIVFIYVILENGKNVTVIYVTEIAKFSCA